MFGAIFKMMLDFNIKSHGGENMAEEEKEKKELCFPIEICDTECLVCGALFPAAKCDGCYECGNEDLEKWDIKSYAIVRGKSVPISFKEVPPYAWYKKSAEKFGLKFYNETDRIINPCEI
jgi:hypothetical protein